MMLARDRLTMILDEGSPWLEIGALSGFEWDDSTPSYVLANLGLEVVES